MRYFVFFVMAAGLLTACGYVPDFDLGGTDDREMKRYPGEACDDAGEPWSVCTDGYVCSREGGICAEAGEAEKGTVPKDRLCTANEHCGFGMVCAASGTCQPEGTTGTAGDGEVCTGSEDCQAFLFCIEDLCRGEQPTNLWPGVSCSVPPKDEFRAFFEVDGASGEFYRLPYPNDIRRKDGKIDLADHPVPGSLSEALGDPAAAFVDMVENDLDGFGSQSAIFFRMTDYPNDETLISGETLFLIDIDPDSDTYGEPRSVGYRVSSGANRYICGNWLALIPSTGYPLNPNTTYAAILTTEIQKGQKSLAQDADFAAMLISRQLSEDRLTPAWEAYQPLRDFLDDPEALALSDRRLPETIAVAAVFTTGDPTKKVKKIREAVVTEESPVIKGLEVEDDTAFTLYRGTVSVPFYQQGTRPFARPADGGDISYRANGRPRLVELEDVPFALTIPHGTVPATGWPVIIFAHGTGGSEVSFIDNGLADRMADVGAAVLGLEQVQHGERRGLSDEAAASGDFTPEYMFYNFLNPRAARDNNLQAAAELFQSVRLVSDFEDISTEAIAFDPERVYFFGHSQGTQGSFLGAAFEPGIKGMILSGAGGVLMESMLEKKQPFDLSTAMSMILMDFDINRVHPMLNIVQTALDSVDPILYAKTVFLEDLSALEIPARSVLMSSGEGDTYTPEMTQYALAKAMGVRQSVTSGEPLDIREIEPPCPADDPDCGEPLLPHQRTYSIGGGVTAVVVRYAPPAGIDGHFVMWENPDAIAQTDAFIETMIDPDVPYPVLIAP